MLHDVAGVVETSVLNAAPAQRQRTMNPQKFPPSGRTQILQSDRESHEDLLDDDNANDPLVESEPQNPRDHSD